MANDIKEIGEIVKKCKILLLDIEGTTTSISFVKDKLFPYAKENVKQFLDSQWETDAAKEAVAALRQLALDDKEKSVDGLVPIPGEDASKEDQIEGLVNNVKWQMSSDRKAGALKQLQGLIWQQGYDSGDIKGHVYDDVSAALEQWRSVDGQKVYIYSSGSVQAQKLLFGQSLAGDLLRFIDGHFDTAVGSKQEAASYSAIVEKIGVKPEDVLFLTDIPKEGEAARAAGLHVALVSREGNAPLPSEASEAFAVLHSFAQLTVSNKRKTEPQDEQPAKVPKTDTSDDVKTVAEPIALDDSVKTSKDEPERMEVEEPSVQATTEKDTQNVETAATVEIEDITDSFETVDVPMVDVEPIVTEAEENKSDASKNVEPEKIIVKEKVKELTEMAKPDVNPDGGETKPHKGVVKIPVEVVTNPDEIVAQSDQIVSKADELVESSKAKDFSEEVPTENSSSKITEELKVQSVEATEPQVNLDSDTPCATVTEIEEIATDNLGDVAEIIEDLEPVVEEPANEEMEDLQNVGEVLEKECDEILSKVQDVTNLDNIPLKPLLNPIAEETMETELDAENMDSNDIVDRILDTELEFEMKQCNDIDLNTVSEITDDTKTNITEDVKMTCDKKIELESNAKLAEKVLENNKQSTPESMDSESSRPEATVENKASHDKSENNEKMESSNIIENSDKVAIDDKMEGNDKKESIEKTERTNQTESNEKIVNNDEIENVAKVENDSNEDKVEKKLEISGNASQATVNAAQDQTESNDKTKKANDVKTEVKKDVLSENSKDEGKKQAKSTDTDINTDSKSETEKESQINGKTINGDTETVNINGDASKVEELNSRLSVENGKKTLNGSNGDSVDSEKGQGDKVEAEVAEIKVKTVATEEPRTDPIEQPTEA